MCEHGSQRGIVQTANLNSPGQIVISGDKIAVQYAMEVAKNLGARKAIELNVSGAFHSPLMAPAKDGLSQIISQTTFNKGAVPVVANVDATPTTDPEKIKSNLIEQLENPVLWEDSVQRMLQEEITEFVEIGPGRVLQGLIKRIHREATTSGIGTLEQLETLS